MPPIPPARHTSLLAGSPYDDARGAPPQRRGFLGLRGLFGSKASEPTLAEHGRDPLMAFDSESGRRYESVLLPEPRRATPEPTKVPPLSSGLLIALFVAVAAVAGVSVVAIRWLPTLFTSSGADTGQLTIETRPVGSEVLIDGEPRGTTPVTLTLTSGVHTVTVRAGNDERVVPLQVVAGADIRHSFEMKADTLAGPPKPVSPVKGAAGVVERTVRVATATTTSAASPPATRPAGAVGGWLSVTAPFEVEVLERGEVIGTSGPTRIAVASGRHDLVLNNRSLEYTEARRIEVTAGRTVAIRVEPPKAFVSMNARPWADVFVDGVHVGQTPIGNLPVAIGSHTVAFRHPQLGERTQAAVVTAKGPNRIAVDLSK